MKGEDYHHGFELLEQAKAFSRAPVSGYQVGAVLITVQGQIFAGANLEFPGQPPSSAVHAEQAAVAAALLRGQRDWRELLVSAPPCGHCRQFLREFDSGSLRVRVLGKDGTESASTLGELLPQAFGGEAFLSDTKGGTERPNPRLPNTDWAAAAREALARSHAPYSGNPAAVVLAGDGHLVAGASLESAAFNPSLGPMACALSQWRMGGREFGEIEHTWLVQSAPRQVNWEQQSRALLASISAAPLTAV
ncbi:MAG: cytidine deaminase [Verrucomicrobiota bacterium JB024]|nr:cytidine deaminase [Verrucomicrobiota bacterium JB024]